MKILCNREILIDSLTTVQKAVPSKTPMPILECLLFEVDENFVITATDLGLGIRQYIPSTVIEPGKIAVNSRLFGDVIRRFTGENVSITTTSENTIKVECGAAKIEMRCLPAEEFPAINLFETENIIEIPQKTIRDSVSQVAFAVGRDEMRPILCGVLFEKVGQKLSFVAIDGMRIALRNALLSEENTNKPDFKLVVPGNVINDISKILADDEKPVKIKYTDKQIMFELDDCLIVSRLLEGDYYNYRATIPQSFSTNTIVDKSKLLNSMELAMTVTMSEQRFPVKFSIENDMLTVTSATDNSNFKDEIEVAMDGDTLHIGFNPRYFVDALKNISTDDGMESIKICFTSAVGPCVIKPIDNDEYVYLILPLKLKE